MIDELGNYLSAEFGRCDRSNSCGYFKYPQNSDSYVKLDLTLPYVANLPKIEGPPSTIPHSYVEKSQKEYEINSFYMFLSKLYNKKDIQRVFALYKVGTSKKWDGATVFWQISKDFEVRTGKVIKFDSMSGKRIKEPFPLISWAHQLLNLKQFNLKQVLFGEHLLSINPDKTVCLVESEKTAIIMAIKQPKFLWLATGSKQEFKKEKLMVLKNRTVIVFPDSDAYNDWLLKSEIISKQINSNFIVSNFIMNSTIALDQSKGYDLVDLIQININENALTPEIGIEQQTPVQKLIERNPNLNELIRVFDLKIATIKQVK